VQKNINAIGKLHCTSTSRLDNTNKQDKNNATYGTSCFLLALLSQRNQPSGP
jgi:hypothetical protein